MGVTVRADNVGRALRAAKEIAEGRTLIREVRAEANLWILAVQATAQDLAPVDEGTLRGSAQSGITIAGTKLTGEITFGGLASAYAEVQHEYEDFEHPKGGQAHYLYGPDSAWEKHEAETLGKLDAAVGKIAERYIGTG